MAPPGTNDQGEYASPASALIYGVAADVALFAVFVAILTNATRGVVVALAAVVVVAAFLAYRATSRYLRSGRRSDPQDTP